MWENEFEKNGYLKKKFFSLAQIKELESLVIQLGYDSDDVSREDKNVRTADEPIDKRKEVFNAINEFVLAHIGQTFEDYEPVVVNVFQKLPSAGRTPLHNHPSIVDENRYKTLTMWIPLHEIPKFGSNLNVIPGSHKIDFNLSTSEINVICLLKSFI